jgi:hypothetical protein
VLVDDHLDPAAVAVQAGHVLTLLAASGERTVARWANTPIVIHAAPTRDLVGAAVAAGAVPGTSGADAGHAWFSEPDLLWALTALATVSTAFGGHPLYTADAPVEPAQCWPRRWLRSLAFDCLRAGVDGPTLWSTAASFGDPADLAVRTRTASLLVRGAEPPPARHATTTERTTP